jgi:UDP-N-acetylglucosamine 2-epimerase (non-hydrolysing)
LHVLHVVGARPNFMKVAPVMAALAGREGISQALVHTGQHYDANMSEIFFRQLGLPEPDVNLEVGSGSHAVQTAHIMQRFEEAVLAGRPDLVLVYGDVNSTVAAALVCAKLLVPVGHVEAGLRSFDRSMPEEINRLLTDQIADLLFTPSTDGNQNLEREGIAPEKIHLVGNVMIDTLVRLLPHALQGGQNGRPKSRQNGKPAVAPEGGYALVTLHRPSNVDEPEMLIRIMAALTDISSSLPVIFPVHPRTRHKLETLSGLDCPPCLHLVEPLGYLDFLALQSRARLVITDSGGIQEESTYLGIPCLTVRENTERPVTVTLGTNTLVGQDMDRLRGEVARILGGDARRGQVPPLWDGRAGERIAEVISIWGS